MPITTGDFPALTDDLQSIHNEVSKNAIAEMVGPKLFDVKDTDRKTYDHLVLHGVEGIRRVAEGSDLPIVNAVQGDAITYTQKRYGALVSVTKDMRKFDLHDQIQTMVRSITQDGWDKVDQSMADVLSNGWSTSYTDVYGETETAVGPDGLALFSTAHTNNLNSNTFRNQIRNSAGTENPTLSRDAIIKARVEAATYQDPNGILRPIHLDTLVVPPSLEDLAMRVVNSPSLPGSMDNDINPLKGKIKNVIVWDRLEATGQGTSRSTYWYMIDSSKSKETLKALFAERPSLDAPEQVYRNKNWEYSVDYYYTLGRGFMPYVWGSKGTNS